MWEPLTQVTIFTHEGKQWVTWTFFFFWPVHESECILGFSISFSSSRPWLNLVFFHQIHYWHISCRRAAVVPEQLTLGHSGGACLIRKTIRMESAQQSLVMQPGAKSHCTVSLLTGCHCCCTYKPSDFAQYLISPKNKWWTAPCSRSVHWQQPNVRITVCHISIPEP